MNHSIKLFILVILTLITTNGCFGITSVTKSTESSNINSYKDLTVLNNESNVVYINYGYKNGDIYLRKYQNIPSVTQLLLVEQSRNESSVGKLIVMTKRANNAWGELMKCKAYLGKNGLGKKQEGDARTPSGDYGFLMAFGAKKNPGSLIPYTKLTDSMYLCGDKEYYNQFIDVKKVSHVCSNASEQLIRYIPQYNYALFIDYNKEHVYGKGSAIFLHCFGNYPYTMGCISISEENMIKILKTITPTARICIYPEQ